MIDEDVLRQLIAEAGESIPVPDKADEVVRRISEPAPAVDERAEKRGRSRWLKPAAALALLLLVLGVVGGFLVGGSSSRVSRLAGPEVPAQYPALPTPDQSTSASVSSQASSSSGNATSRANSGASSASSASSGNTGNSTNYAASEAVGETGGSAGAATSSADSAKVVKTAEMEIEVRSGSFGDTVDRITSLAAGYGGYVSGSSTAASDQGERGSMAVRVPAESFDRLLTEVRALGSVKEFSSQGTDVTSQFTDLAARLSALVATRDKLLGVQANAGTVTEIISVQDRITTVQTQIEEIQGKQRQLENQADLGTVTVMMAEPGAVSIDDEPRTGLGAAWDEARHRFGNSVEGFVEWIGSAAFLILLGAAIVAGGRYFWLRHRRGVRL